MDNALVPDTDRSAGQIIESLNAADVIDEGTGSAQILVRQDEDGSYLIGQRFDLNGETFVLYMDEDSLSNHITQLQAAQAAIDSHRAAAAAERSAQRRKGGGA